MKRLTKEEMKEWKSISRKSKKYNIPIKRIKGTPNVIFTPNRNWKTKIYAQLGTGTATNILDSRIRIIEKKK